MADKLAQLAADREDATNMRVRHLTEVARNASQAHLEQTRDMEDAFDTLKQRLADSDSPILPLAPPCAPLPP
jgi:hypothetical protein